MDTAALRDHVKAILDHGYDLSHDKLPEAPKTLRPPKQVS